MIRQQGSSYLLYELTKTMLEISTPVIRLHALEMLSVHDAVFLREQKPDFHEG